MAGLIIRRAGEADHAALEDLFRETTMGRAVRIGFERDPDFFATSAVQSDEPCVIAAFDGAGRAVGVFSAGRSPMRIGSQVQPMRYLSDLRIHPDYRRTGLLGRGFRVLRREVFEPGEWARTLVLEDNAAALRLLTSGRGGLPEYRPAGRYECWVLPRQRVASDGNVTVRRAREADLGAMQDLLDRSQARRCFSPASGFLNVGEPAWRDLTMMDFLLAERNGRLAGMIGLWDQSAFQRMRIHGYTAAAGLLRPVWNRFSTVKAPRAGSVLGLVKATAIACEDDDPAALRCLLGAALAGIGGCMLLIGFSTEDPLLAGVRGLKGRRSFGRHFLVGWEGEPPAWREPFMVDPARI